MLLAAITDASEGRPHLSRISRSGRMDLDVDQFAVFGAIQMSHSLISFTHAQL
jgi:hypothetical protein